MMGSVLLSTCAVVLALQAAGLARAQNDLATEPPPSLICGLEGFHLNILQIPDFWQVDLTDKTQCIIPKGMSETDVKSCTIYFSVCKSLPPEKCGGLTNSTTCEEVILNSGPPHYYGIGDYRGNDEFAPLGGEVVGFAAIRQGSQAVNSTLCNQTYETFIVWRCDGEKTWDPKTVNVNAFFVDSSHGDCLLEVNLDYSGACYTAPTLAPDTCQLEPFSFISLASQDYWTATVSNDICYNEGTTECRIFISFCGALPLIAKGCYGAAVCQVGTNANGDPYAYSMGLYKTAKYAENTEKGVVGFHLDVKDGSIPDDGGCAQRGGISTRVVLLCNSSVKWTNQDLGSNLHIEHTGFPSPCEYNIVLPYDGACKPAEPESASSPQSFVGWILIGIFFFAVMVYLFVGAGFGYFVKGARGIEVIPNYAFWMLFFSLVLEGCKFSFDAITCFQFEGKIKNPLGGVGKGGVDYDKI